MDKRIIKAMAEAERLMDAGIIPFVLAPGPSGLIERLAMTKEQMEEFGLVQGQRINTIIRDAILEANLKRISKILSKFQEDVADTLMQAEDEEMLDPNFDFRNLMNDEGENDA